VKKPPTSPGREKDGGKESNFQIWYVAVAAMIGAVLLFVFRVIIRRRNDGRRRMDHKRRSRTFYQGQKMCTTKHVDNPVVDVFMMTRVLLLLYVNEISRVRTDFG
jgi:hypothetical protein